MSEEDKILSILEERCYKSNIFSAKNNRNDFCEPVFDRLFCWNATTAGTLAKQSCSNDLIKSENSQGVATRQCTENGSWYVPEGFNNSWTNLSDCGRFYIKKDPDNPPLYSEHLKWLPILKNISYVGYTVSLIALIISICILVTIKRLHCARNKLHIHLFMSFVIRLFMTIIKDSLFVGGTTLVFETDYDEFGTPKISADQSYSWICKAIISIRWYFILSNFAMMLMEGIYLHNLMFLNLLSDRTSVSIYCFLGWSLPSLFVTPWIITTAVYEDILCWTQNNNVYITLFLDLPIGITVVINFILFTIIVRVLTVKLNNVGIQQRRMKYRKFIRATLILIPLFGIPYTFSLPVSLYIMAHPSGNPALELSFLFFDQTFTAFQGLFAALAYCLLNSEVQMEVRRKYLSIKDRNGKEFRRSRTISNTQQFSLHTNDEDWNDKGHHEELATNSENHF